MHNLLSPRRALAVAVAALALLIAGIFGATTPAHASAPYSCTTSANDSCGPYGDTSAWPGANGFNTYVANQFVNPQGGTETVEANSPADWEVLPNLPSCGGCVQTFPSVQQLTNNYNPNDPTAWNGSSDTPLSALKSLAIHYNVTPASGSANQYEFAPDIWNDNYGDDVMFWADTSHLRCTDNGLSSSDILGQHKSWTAYRYGGFGGEIVFIKDGVSGDTDPVDHGTCAQQTQGTIGVKGGLGWLKKNGFITGKIVLSMVNSGWEVTQGDGSPLVVNDYYITTN